MLDPLKVLGVPGVILLTGLAACGPAGESTASEEEVASTPENTEVMESRSDGLEGTSWQLVEFQGMDDTTLTPDDGSKYTLSFEPEGVLVARIDCNRGRGTWRVEEPSGLEFGPMAMTRAACPPGSLHDQILRQWEYIRSFVLQDGHLYLALMADGGIYEFEPAEDIQP